MNLSTSPPPIETLMNRSALFGERRGEGGSRYDALGYPAQPAARLDGPRSKKGGCRAADRKVDRCREKWRGRGGEGRFGTAMNISPGALIYAILCAGRFTASLSLSLPSPSPLHRRVPSPFHG